MPEKPSIPQEGSGETLVLLFCDSRYLPVLANWLLFARRLGSIRVCVYALDEATEAFGRRVGVEAKRLEWDGTKAGLWATRLRVIADLCNRGIPLITSDADCIWLRDPRPLMDRSADLVFSQGTVFPRRVHQRWGFVLCCGLFCVHPTTAAASFLRLAAQHVETSGDDQVTINEMLLDGQTRWERIDAPDYRLRMSEETFSAWVRPTRGVSDEYGLTVDLLPHRLVQRIPDPIAREADVVAKHYLTPKDAEAKIDEFRRQGLCALRDDWRTVAIGASIEDYAAPGSHGRSSSPSSRLSSSTE